MVNDEKDNKKSLDNSVITAKMIVVAFTSPVFFSVALMAIAYFATSNSSETVRTISLIVATFLGLGVSIGVIFFMQKLINKKSKAKEDESL